MKKNPNINTVSAPKKVYPIREELEEIAIIACAKFGGMALINDHFALVDTTKYKVSPK